MADQLVKEFQYYIDNQKELVRKYDGKVLVIKDCKVVGSYDSEIEALKKSLKLYDGGTFLIQICGPGKENYTNTFHSRVLIG